VFSPLLSLMQDQVDAMTAIGIRLVITIHIRICFHKQTCFRAVCLSSHQDASENKAIVNELRSYESADQSNSLGNSCIKMLYITPEMFNKSQNMRSCLRHLASNGLLSRFVIDEAHCLSQVRFTLNSNILLSLSRCIAVGS
jgi:superfamily II DNA helicase RecQ